MDFAYAGAIYYFASGEDKAEFDKTPAKYAPQYGGFCANSMSKRKLSDINPNQFLIYKTKFGKNHAQSHLIWHLTAADLNRHGRLSFNPLRRG
jgi:hypothetical protein